MIEKAENCQLRQHTERCSEEKGAETLPTFLKVVPNFAPDLSWEKGWAEIAFGLERWIGGSGGQASDKLNFVWTWYYVIWYVILRNDEKVRRYRLSESSDGGSYESRSWTEDWTEVCKTDDNKGSWNLGSNWRSACARQCWQGPNVRGFIASTSLVRKTQIRFKSAWLAVEDSVSDTKKWMKRPHMSGGW